VGSDFFDFLRSGMAAGIVIADVAEHSMSGFIYVQLAEPCALAIYATPRKVKNSRSYSHNIHFTTYVTLFLGS
jgi:hypothetical protein